MRVGMNLISEVMTHLDCLYQFYLRDYLFNWWRKQ